MMRHRRRDVLRAMMVIAMPLAPVLAADPQAYPAHAMRIIVGFPPGGPLDIVAHIIAPWLATRLGQKVTVENLVGGSGNVATAMVAHAPADGHTLLLCGPVSTINTTLYAGTLDFDFGRDIAPVAGIASVPLVVEVHPSVPASSAAELIALAKANPGKLRVGYAGTGTPQHIAIEMFKMMSGADLTLTPYPGSAAVLADLLDGRVHVMFDPLPSSLPHIRAGKLIPLAVTGTQRSAALPDTPLFSDVLPGYTAGSWFGLGAPRGTPAAIVDRLNTAINAGLANAAVAGQLAAIGATSIPGPPSAFAGFLVDETQRYRRVIEAAGIKIR